MLISSTNNYIFSLFQQNGVEVMPDFYVILCFDNLLEVLRFGCRRRLAKLERIGRRIHLIVENYLDKIPFLRLDIQLKIGYSFFFDLNKFPLHMLLREL